MGKKTHVLGRVVAVVAAVMLGAVASGWAVDADRDGVDDAVDACPGTVIPEGVPTKVLLPLHYALTDNDHTFNTFKGQESSFTTADTAGCSCEQIIALSSLGPLHTQFGCSRDVLEAFSTALQAAPPGQQFPATGQMTCYDSGETGIPCAGTGQDGEIQAGATLSYTDNDDGTITDNNTHLMWEKLCDEDPPGTTCPAEHHWEIRYTWEAAFGKIATLNTTPCFAGYCDWRLPNVKELHSIVNYQNVRPAVSAVFHTGCIASCSVTTCSCTSSGPYWSSTSFTADSPVAWYVYFENGLVGNEAKSNLLLVRAVRGGT